MSQFNYKEFQKYESKVQQVRESYADGGKRVGYFKLKDDGDVAIARLNVSSIDDLEFAAVHNLNSNGRWMRVSCLDPLKEHTHVCPLCEKAKADPSKNLKASQKVYIKMLVRYKEGATFSEEESVVWERPASFANDIASKLAAAGDLRNVLVMITRDGKAGDMQTKYIIDLVYPTNTSFPQDMISTNFSAFDNFNINRHSYWEKTEAEMNQYLVTGSFPEVINNNTQAAAQNTYNAAPTQPQYQQQTYQAPTQAYAAPQQPAQTFVQPQPAQQPAPAQQPQYTNPWATQAPAEAPAVPQQPTQAQPAQTGTQGATRNFNGFEFKF